MALTLNIPVRTSITLPDDWQECQTSQQLAYWLIAKFNEIAKTHDINELRSLVEDVESQLGDIVNQVDGLENEVNRIGGDVGNIGQRTETMEEDISSLKRGLEALDGVVTNLGYSVSSVAEVQFLDGLTLGRLNYTMPNYNTTRFFVRAGIVLNDVNITLPTEPPQLGEHLEFIFGGEGDGAYIRLNVNGATVVSDIKVGSPDGNAWRVMLYYTDDQWNYSSSYLPLSNI